MVRVSEMSDGILQNIRQFLIYSKLQENLQPKKSELETVDPDDHELLDIERFMEIYRNVKPLENQADSEFDEEAPNSQQLN